MLLAALLATFSSSASALACEPLRLPPGIPLHPDMRRVLFNGAVALAETVVWSHAPPLAAAAPAPCPEVAVAVAGLARACEHAELVRFQLEPCTLGHAAVALVLQARDNRVEGQFTSDSAAARGGESYDFEACVANVQAAVRGTRCRLVLVHLEFKRAFGVPRPCGRNDKGAHVRQSGRVLMQSVAVGRAFEWARALLPTARGFVRGRMDSIWCAPSAPTAHPPGTLVLDAYSVEEGRGGSRWAADTYAFMRAEDAPRYFEAWRVFATMSCEWPCLAANASAACLIYYPALTCSGETALSAYLCDSFGGSNASWVAAARRRGGGAGGAGAARPRWLRFDRTPMMYVTPHATRADLLRTRRKGYVNTSTLLALLRRRRAVQCPRCAPDCLLPLQVYDSWLGVVRDRRAAANGTAARCGARMTRNEECMASAQARAWEADVARHEARPGARDAAASAGVAAARRDFEWPWPSPLELRDQNWAHWATVGAMRFEAGHVPPQCASLPTHRSRWAAQSSVAGEALARR